MPYNWNISSGTHLGICTEALIWPACVVWCEQVVFEVLSTDRTYGINSESSSWVSCFVWWQLSYLWWREKYVTCKELLHATSAAGYMLILTGLSLFQIIFSYDVVLKICHILCHLYNKKTNLQLHPAESGISVVRNLTVSVRNQRLYQTCHWYSQIPQSPLQLRMHVCILVCQ